MKKKIFLSMVLMLIALPFLVHAQTPLQSFTEGAGLGPLGFKAPQQIVAEIIAVILEFVGIIAVAMLLWAGFRYMTSQGNQDKIDASLKTIRNAVIGILIIMSAYSIAAWTIYTYACRGIGQTNVRVEESAGDSGNLPSFNLNWRSVSQECLGQLRYQIDIGF